MSATRVSVRGQQHVRTAHGPCAWLPLIRCYLGRYDKAHIASSGMPCLGQAQRARHRSSNTISHACNYIVREDNTRFCVDLSTVAGVPTWGQSSRQVLNVHRAIRCQGQLFVGNPPLLEAAMSKGPPQSDDFL